SRILRELDGLLEERTPVEVVFDDSLVAARSVGSEGCSKLDVSFDSTDDELSRLHELIPAREYEHMVVLGYRDGLTPGQAGARTMLTLLALRRLNARCPWTPRVVAEVLDSRDTAVAETAGADDLVVSDRLASLMVAQLAER